MGHNFKGLICAARLLSCRPSLFNHRLHGAYTCRAQMRAHIVLTAARRGGAVVSTLLMGRLRLGVVELLPGQPSWGHTPGAQAPEPVPLTSVLSRQRGQTDPQQGCPRWASG